MSVSVIVCEIWPLVIWPSPVTFIILQGHFHFYHKMDVMLLSIASKYEVVSFNRIWDMDNCLEKIWMLILIMTSPPIRILWNLNTNRTREYLSNKLNFILIELKGICNPRYLPNDFFALSAFLDDLKPSYFNLSIQKCP